MKALTIAATGMNAQQLNLEVIANNIANINTTGFKRARAEFTDLLYQSERTADFAEGKHIKVSIDPHARTVVLNQPVQ
ncbi:flagellar hook-basal body family protein [Brucella suis]|nr:flagellar hook-basal body family protein [Brucella suis]EEY27591.1 predicted protein [Brucella suis bv. 5 str. 513]